MLVSLKRSHIMLHHSLTADGATVSWGAIRKYHVETNGWQDIGYHYGVERVGDQYEALVGRPENEIAAACKEGLMNTLAIHVCCVGNFDLEEPSDELLEVLCHRVLLPVMLRHEIPSSKIVGHRDYAHYKTCPGAKFDLGKVRRILS